MDKDPKGNQVNGKPFLNSSIPKTSRRKILETISNDSSGILTKLFHIICYDLTNDNHFSPTVWKRLMDRYLDEAVKRDPTLNRQNERGNFTKALRAKKMSWMNFFKSLRFLQFVRFRLIIEGTRANGVTTIHQLSVNLSDVSDENMDIDVDVFKPGGGDDDETNSYEKKE